MDGLTPISTVPPKLPHKLHNEFFGKAVVSFVIEPPGNVRSAFIKSTEWRPSGHRNDEPIGYNEAILTAVSQWRYPQRPKACSNQVSIDFQ